MKSVEKCRNTPKQVEGTPITKLVVNKDKHIQYMNPQDIEPHKMENSGSLTDLAA